MSRPGLLLAGAAHRVGQLAHCWRRPHHHVPPAARPADAVEPCLCLGGRAGQAQQQQRGRDAAEKCGHVERGLPAVVRHREAQHERHRRCTRVLARREQRVPGASCGRVGEPRQEDVGDRRPPYRLHHAVERPQRRHRRQRSTCANAQIDHARQEQAADQEKFGRSHVDQRPVEKCTSTVDDLEARAQHAHLALTQLERAKHRGQPEAVALACREKCHVPNVNERKGVHPYTRLGVLESAPARAVDRPALQRRRWELVAVV